MTGTPRGSGRKKPTLPAKLQVWVKAEPDLTVEGKTAETLTFSIGPEILVEATLDPPDRMLLRHRRRLLREEVEPLGETPSERGRALDALAADVALIRAGPLRVTVSLEEEGPAIIVEQVCPLDGLTRLSFSDAVGEIAKARGHLDTVLGVPEAATVDAGSPEPTTAPSVSAPETPVSDATTPDVAELFATAQPAWAPTHVAGQGVRAWAAPDPSAAAIADLAPGTELRLLERLGEWARVDASNGWSGWVDARLLRALGGVR